MTKELWFQRESNATLFKALLEDLNKATEDPAIEWVNSCYHNDACGSVCAVYIDNDSIDTVVQLFAYETEEDAALEEMPRYGLTVNINGDTAEDADIATNDRNLAIAEAVKAAVEVSGGE